MRRGSLTQYFVEQQRKHGKVSSDYFWESDARHRLTMRTDGARPVGR